MTLTLHLPEDVASRLALLSDDERSRFSVAAIADALRFREDELDCVDAVKQALAEMDEGRGLVSFDDVCRQWDAEKVARPISEST
jgi:predicted transcriptional regulator